MSGTMRNFQFQCSAGAEHAPLTNDEALLMLECPICFEFALPPIHQCKAGHILCSKCYPALETCPSCEAPLQDIIRNRLMEDLAAKVMFPCKNPGCPAYVLYPGMRQHQENCNYRRSPCPRPRCPWSGSFDQVKDHVMTCCSSTRSLGRTYTVSINLTQNNKRKIAVTVLTCYGEHFMFVLGCEERNGETIYYSYVQLLGNPNKIDLFTYSLELSKGSDRFIWETTPRSIYDRYRSIRKSKCLSIGTALAKEYSQNDKLTINVTITRKPNGTSHANF